MVLEPVALFGKVHATGDYSWAMGADALPAGFAKTCELLAELADVPISLAARLDDALWLARTFRSGSDSANRPAIAVEVLRSRESALSPREMLLLAAASFAFPESPHRQAFEVALPAARSESPALPEELVARFRLRLPISTTPLPALELGKRCPWRYAGICHAHRLTSNPIRWRPQLADYMCVNFGEAALGPQEASAVQAVLERRPSEEEWAALERLPSSQAVRALSMARQHLEATAATFAPDDPLLPWLIAYLGNWHARGGPLLSAVRRRVTGAVPAGVLAQIAPGLGEDAGAALATALEGNAPDLTREVAEELARHGLLGGANALPLAQWVGWSQESPPLAEAAIHSLEAEGLATREARFVLDLESDRAAERPQPTQTATSPPLLVEAISLAVKLQLPTPRRRLLSWLQLIDSEPRLVLFAEIATRYGGWAQELARFALAGELPSGSGGLDEADMVAALRARCAAGRLHSLEAALASLLSAGQRDRAQSLLEAAARDELLAPAEEISSVLRARLELGPPAVPPPLDQLRVLVHHGLARSGDVAPAPGADIGAYAALWSDTEPLSRLLRHPETAAGQPPLVPEPWLPAIRAALTPARAQGWLLSLSEKDRQRARFWLAELHGLAGIETLWSEGSEPLGRETLLRASPWIGTLLFGTTRARHLTALARLAVAHVLVDDETLAAELTRQMLPAPTGDDRANDLVIHALCARGPLPSLHGVPADVIVAMAATLDPVEVASAVFAGEALQASQETMIAEALAQRIQESGQACPATGYLARQLSRHPYLAHRLGSLAGWENVAPGEEDRRRLHSRLGCQLGLAAPAGQPRAAPDEPNDHDGGNEKAR